MGKSWDSSGIAYNVEVWRQCLRVLKPGGHLLSFSATRTYHRMTVAVEDAGFEIRDMIAWISNKTFPKSLNIHKAINKIDNSNIDWLGWGTGLKPNLEPIVLARKPLEMNVAENVLKFGVGGLNIDATRIDERWPSNVMLDEESAKIVDEQSGEIVLTKGMKSLGSFGFVPGEKANLNKKFIQGIRTKGGASSFFYVSKIKKHDRNEGTLENFHPTVKPTDLMRQLVRLVTPPNGTVLDPFTGSGSTGKAAILEGMQFVGCELTPEYLPIIQGRINYAVYVKEQEAFSDGEKLF